MGSNKFQRIMSGLFCVVFAMLYAWICLLCLTKPQIIPLNMTKTISAAAVVGGICYLYYRYGYRREFRGGSAVGKKNRDMLHLMIFFLVYIPVQVYFAAQLYEIEGTSWDFNVVAKYAMAYANYPGDVSNYREVMAGTDAAVYFSSWPNNIPLYLFLGTVFRWFAGTGVSLNAVGMGINILAIDIAIAFMYLSVEKATGTSAAADVSLLLAAVHVPLLVYVPNYYTDTLTLPFPIIAFYLWLNVKEELAEGKMGKAPLYTVIMTVLLAVGAVLKLSVIFFLIAAAVDALVCMKPRRSLVLIAVLLIVGIGLYMLMYQACLDSPMVVSDEEGCYIPKLHWIMMGLQGKGNYFNPDYQLILSVPEESRDEVALNMIKLRLKDYGVKGFLDHMHKKIAFVWAEGTYYSSLKVDRDRPGYSWLDRYVNWNGSRFKPYAEYCQGLLLLNLISFAVCAVSILIQKPKRNQLLLVALISIFGIFLFECLWEARSRYIFNYLPVFLTVTCSCWGNIMNKRKK